MSPNNASMQEFKVNLPSTVMFNYPTIEGITGPGTELEVSIYGHESQPLTTRPNFTNNNPNGLRLKLSEALGGRMHPEEDHLDWLRSGCDTSGLLGIFC